MPCISRELASDKLASFELASHFLTLLPVLVTSYPKARNFIIELDAPKAL